MKCIILETYYFCLFIMKYLKYMKDVHEQQAKIYKGCDEQLTFLL